jgi:hypothetical protein
LAADPMEFIVDDSFSQIVVSESAASCILNQISRSKIGTLDLNEERMNTLFGVDYIKLDS